MCDTASTGPDLSRRPLPETCIRVMVAFDHDAPLPAWLSGLAQADGIRLVDVPPADPALPVRLMSQARPDVVLLDRHRLHRADPCSLRSFQLQHAGVHVLLLSHASYPGVAGEVLRNGFRGFLSTRCPSPLCVQAIRAVCRGELWLSRASLVEALTGLLPPPEPPVAPVRPLPFEDAERLTRREAEVVRFLRHGCTNKEIALELGIMEDTVKKHLQSVFAKLGVHRRALVALGRARATA